MANKRTAEVAKSRWKLSRSCQSSEEGRGKKARPAKDSHKAKELHRVKELGLHKARKARLAREVEKARRMQVGLLFPPVLSHLR